MNLIMICACLASLHYCSGYQVILPLALAAIYLISECLE